MEQKIPKIIHYVWMGGGKKSELVEKCIESWKKFCPDYEIREWNESVFDVDSHAWVKKAVAERNWALASDIIRLHAVYTSGGIYLDTDAEIVRPLDRFLAHEFFIGYEGPRWFGPHAFGAVKGHPALEMALERYKGDCDIKFNTNPLTVHTYSAVTNILYGLKPDGKTRLLDNGVAVYARDFFAPQHYLQPDDIMETENTHVFHHYTNTWLSKKQKSGAGFALRSRKILGRSIYAFFEGMVAKNYLRKLKKEYKKIEKAKAKKPAE